MRGKGVEGNAPCQPPSWERKRDRDDRGRDDRGRSDGGADGDRGPPCRRRLKVCCLGTVIVSVIVIVIVTATVIVNLSNGWRIWLDEA